MFSFQVRINHRWPTYSVERFLFLFFWLSLLNKSFSTLWQASSSFFSPLNTVWPCGQQNFTSICENIIRKPQTFFWFQAVDKTLEPGQQDLHLFTHKWCGCTAFGFCHGWWRRSVANLAGAPISFVAPFYSPVLKPQVTDAPPSLMCAFHLLPTLNKELLQDFSKASTECCKLNK